jgi:hypothetical protein
LVNHLIEQYSITATPKYNFPQPLMDTPFPRGFAESSLNSLHGNDNRSFQLRQLNFQQIDQEAADVHATKLKLPPFSLKPRNAETTVAAVDTSTIKLGETDTGLLLAVRGATVWKQNKAYRYTRFGPFVFHITEKNRHSVCAILDKAYFELSSRQDQRSLPNLLQMPTRIASLLERWLQLMLAKTMNNGLILLDGSLTAGTPDAPTVLIKDILSRARTRENIILAFSKMTTIRVNDYVITEFPIKQRPPYIIELEGLKPKPPLVLLGDVYVAKLASSNYSFRMDIDREATFEQRIWSVEKLLGNDLLSQSYPETLRLAHILCTFTANEVIAMRHFATRRYGLNIVNRPDMHSLLFGPFGKGEYYS